MFFHSDTKLWIALKMRSLKEKCQITIMSNQASAWLE